VEADEFKDRKAPYAPVSAFQEFLLKIRNVGVPPRVDQRFLQKHSIAAGNEWALLSALKFLGIIGSQGEPTPAYRRLLSSAESEDTLRHLIESAYAPLFEEGGMSKSAADLENYFRVTSSPSQARNAARFFRALCSMAGVSRSDRSALQPITPERAERPAAPPVQVAPASGETGMRELVLRAKASLLEKLPAPQPEWSASEYRAICEQFLEMLRHLDA
jgi:hypothetical protein